MRTEKKLISIVVSAYNEEENIFELHRNIDESLKELSDIDCEIIFVNDGSSDNTKLRILELLDKDKRVKLVDLVRNFGHELAMTAGMDYSLGSCVIFMDADLQHPPIIIRDMIKYWQSGVDVVLTKRIDKADESKINKIRGKLFYKILNLLSDFEIPAQAPDFRLIDRKYIEVVKRMKENNRMFRGLISWIGVKNKKVIEFKAPERFAGKSKYSNRKLIRLALDSVLSFSIKPLRFATYFGIIAIIISAIMGATMIFDYLTNENYETTGFATTALLVIFIGSVQLIFLGIIGEYIGRIHLEVKNRPLYVAEYFINKETD